MSQAAEPVPMTFTIHPDSLPELARLLAEAQVLAFGYQQNLPLRSQDPSTRRYHWGAVRADLKAMETQIRQRIEELR